MRMIKHEGKGIKCSECLKVHDVVYEVGATKMPGFFVCAGWLNDLVEMAEQHVERVATEPVVPLFDEEAVWHEYVARLEARAIDRVSDEAGAGARALADLLVAEPWVFTDPIAP